MVGDTVLTGSDDWTARMWSVSRGTCDAVLACHAGPVQCVEYSATDKGIITGLHYFLGTHFPFPLNYLKRKQKNLSGNRLIQIN